MLPEVSDTVCDNLFNGTDGDIHKDNKPFVKVFTSDRVGAGKTFMIQKFAEKLDAKPKPQFSRAISSMLSLRMLTMPQDEPSQSSLLPFPESDPPPPQISRSISILEEDAGSLIRIPINSPDIDIGFIVNRLYQGYQNSSGTNIIYHFDISSSASNTVNDILFSLLFLRFIKTPRNRCFSTRNNMIFLIEVPTDLASLRTKQNEKKVSVQEEFYLLHHPMRFSTQRVNNNTNIFELNKDCHYAATFLSYFHGGRSHKEDPDPADKKQVINNAVTLLPKSSPIHDT